MKTALQDPPAKQIYLNLGNRIIYDRNVKILQLLCKDKTPEEIAHILNLSIRTTRSAIQQMKDKNNYHTLCGLLADAFRAKIIS